jgi:hypothetical protein
MEQGVPAEHADSLFNSRLSHFAAGESWNGVFKRNMLTGLFNSRLSNFDAGAFGNKVFQRNLRTVSSIEVCHTSPLASLVQGGINIQKLAMASIWIINRPMCQKSRVGRRIQRWLNVDGPAFSGASGFHHCLRQSGMGMNHCCQILG